MAVARPAAHRCGGGAIGTSADAQAHSGGDPQPHCPRPGRGDPRASGLAPDVPLPSAGRIPRCQSGSGPTPTPGQCGRSGCGPAEVRLPTRIAVVGTQSRGRIRSGETLAPGTLRRRRRRHAHPRRLRCRRLWRTGRHRTRRGAGRRTGHRGPHHSHPRRQDHPPRTAGRLNPLSRGPDQ